MASHTPHTKRWPLNPESEYRFELDPGTVLAIKLVEGTAEVFGFELVENKVYIFGFECKAAVYSWKGSSPRTLVPDARVRIFLLTPVVLIVHPTTQHVTGEPSTEYVSDETPMRVYGNLHIALEQVRVRALSYEKAISSKSTASGAGRGRPAQAARPFAGRGRVYPTPGRGGAAVPHQPNPPSRPPTDPPRVLILGPENAGKTSLCKILTNYIVRSGQGWKPYIVNVDPSEGGWTVPGTISTAPILGPIATASPANPLGSAATTAPMSLASHALLPLVYWYGHADMRKNPIFMERLIRNMGAALKNRVDGDLEASAAGYIVDTPSSFATGPASDNEMRQKLIKACVEAFRINVIVVLGHEKLNVEMDRTYGSTLKVVKVPKSGGVVELDQPYRQRVTNYQLHTYMYGQAVQLPPGITNALFGGENATELVLSPSSTTVNFGDLNIYKIGTDAMAPLDVLPVGASRTVSEMVPIPVDPASPGSGLLNSVLALMAPPNPDENERYDEELLDLNVVGFLIVTGLDIPKRKMTILAPNRESFAGRTAVLGSFEWQDM